METTYDDITNSHASKNVTVTVEASILALTSGSHTCQLTLGSSTVDLTYQAVDVTGPVTDETWLDLNQLLCHSWFLLLNNLLIFKEWRDELQRDDDRTGVQKQYWSLRRRIDCLGTWRNLPPLVRIKPNQHHLPASDIGICKHQPKQNHSQHVFSAVFVWLSPLLENVLGWDYWRFGRLDLFEPRADRVSGKLCRIQKVVHKISHTLPPTMVSEKVVKSKPPVLFRFEDVGTLQVDGICPTQLHAKGKNRFRARGIFENIPGQNSFFRGTLKNDYHRHL